MPGPHRTYRKAPHIQNGHYRSIAHSYLASIALVDAPQAQAARTWHPCRSRTARRLDGSKARNAGPVGDLLAYFIHDYPRNGKAS
jgi:hypothetical protein